MARSKSASLHSGLLIRKGEAIPAPPPALNAHQNTAEEVERNFRDGGGPETSNLSPTLDRFVNAGQKRGQNRAQNLGQNRGENKAAPPLPAEIDTDGPGIEIEVTGEVTLPFEMEAQAEIRSVADILALGRTRGALPIPQAALGHANGGAIVTLHLTAAQIERLDSIADEAGIPAANLVMNAVTEYIHRVVSEN